MRIGDISFRKAMVQRPEMVDWFSAVHHDYQSSFAAEEVDQELEEGIDRESLEGSVAVLEEKQVSYLIDITNWVYKHGSLK